MKRTAKRLSMLAVLLAAASIVFLIESLIPPLFPLAPYVKIGLANVFVLFVIIVFGPADAFLFVLAKNLLTALFAGWYAFPFNIAGSVYAYLAMAGTYCLFFPKISLVSVSVLGAIVSNIARTAVAAAVLEAPSLFVQVPFVAIFSTAAGIIVGVLTTFSVKYLPERLTKIK